MDRIGRPIGWIRGARKAYAAVPPPVRDHMNTALTIAAHGTKAEIAKRLKSKSGIGTPRSNLNVVKTRLRRLRRELAK
ncbi:MAG: hypothetical protein F4X36_08900 [Gammaproteobacteria bacterium]|nr:hypothetical protein [Gammaproteobacteria bacterium]